MSVLINKLRAHQEKYYPSSRPKAPLSAVAQEHSDSEDSIKMDVNIVGHESELEPVAAEVE